MASNDELLSQLMLAVVRAGERLTRSTASLEKVRVTLTAPMSGCRYPAEFRVEAESPSADAKLDDAGDSVVATKC
jgi:hypothetical protein